MVELGAWVEQFAYTLMLSLLPGEVSNVHVSWPCISCIYPVFEKYTKISRKKGSVDVEKHRDKFITFCHLTFWWLMNTSVFHMYPGHIYPSPCTRRCLILSNITMSNDKMLSLMNLFVCFSISTLPFSSDILIFFFENINGHDFIWNLHNYNHLKTFNLACRLMLPHCA